MISLLLTVTLAISFDYGIAASNDFKLELVQVLFRHGDRIPDKVEVYKTDPYDPLYYRPTGYGQLTKIGMQREYKIGQILRKRYDTFLKEYRTEHVYAYSTNYDRTKMSLQLVLAGLYPPTRRTLWNENINWSPIPTHYKPVDIDFMRIKLDNQCNEYGKQFNDAEKSPELSCKLKEYSDFYKHLRNHTDITTENPFTIQLIYNNLRCILSMGLPLPKWCSVSDYKKLEDLASMGYDSLIYTDSMKRIAVGPMLDEFLKNINNNENGKDSRKIYLYGAHDVNVATFCRAHKFTNVPKIPDYGSTIIIEKLRGLDGQIYIRMLLWTGVAEELIPLKVNGCNHECLLSDYLKAVNHILLNDEERTCLSSNNCRTKRRANTVNPELLEPYFFAGSDLHSFKYSSELLDL